MHQKMHNQWFHQWLVGCASLTVRFQTKNVIDQTTLTFGIQRWLVHLLQPSVYKGCNRCTTKYWFEIKDLFDQRSWSPPMICLINSCALTELMQRSPQISNQKHVLSCLPLWSPMQPRDFQTLCITSSTFVLSPQWWSLLEWFCTTCARWKH